MSDHTDGYFTEDSDGYTWYRDIGAHTTLVSFAKAAAEVFEHPEARLVGNGIHEARGTLSLDGDTPRAVVASLEAVEWDGLEDEFVVETLSVGYFDHMDGCEVATGVGVKYERDEDENDWDMAEPCWCNNQEVSSQEASHHPRYADAVALACLVATAMDGKPLPGELGPSEN